MAKLVWDQSGQKIYEAGVSNGVLYPLSEGAYAAGYAWNGLVGVTESPSGAEPTAHYANNKKYLNILSSEEYAASIEAFTYPVEFEECMGMRTLAQGAKVAQQTRKPFGLVYKSLIGNDQEGTDFAYKLHIVYNCLAAPTDKSHQTISDNTEPGNFTWDVSTTPEDIEGMKPSATIEIDSRTTDAALLAALEETLFGSEAVDASLPLPAAIKTALTPAG